MRGYPRGLGDLQRDRQGSPEHAAIIASTPTRTAASTGTRCWTSRAATWRAATCGTRSGSTSCNGATTARGRWRCKRWGGDGPREAPSDRLTSARPRHSIGAPCHLAECPTARGSAP
jgi:hypothetical protein